MPNLEKESIIMETTTSQQHTEAPVPEPTKYHLGKVILILLVIFGIILCGLFVVTGIIFAVVFLIFFLFVILFGSVPVHANAQPPVSTYQSAYVYEMDIPVTMDDNFFM